MAFSLCPTTFAEVEKQEDDYVAETQLAERFADAEEPDDVEEADSSKEPDNVEQPGSCEEPGDVEEPDSGEEPDNVEEPGGGEEPGNAEELGSGEEPDEAQEIEDLEEAEVVVESQDVKAPEKEFESENSSLVVLHVVSEQALHFVLTGPEGEIDPVTEEELEAYFEENATEPSVEEPALETETVVAGEPASETEAATAEEFVVQSESVFTGDPVGEPEEKTAAEAQPVVTEEVPAALFEAKYLLQPGSYTWSAEAEGFRPRENAALEVTAETTLNITLEAALPYGFKGMPDGWTPSAKELAFKKALSEHNVVETLAKMKPGTDYIEREVWFTAESAEYAAVVAEAYSAKLKSFEFEVAVLSLTTATTLEAVTAAADLSLSLPSVSANYLAPIEPTESTAPDREKEIDIQSGEMAPTRQNWLDWYESHSNPDTYLMNPTSSDYQYMHDVVNTYEAWGVTRGAGVTVAVIDTGVTSHEDLPSISRADVGCGTGSIGDHGTHVAGIVAARMGNGIGGAGIAPEANILSIRVAQEEHNMPYATIAEGVEAARKSGAKVINMSLGGFGYSPEMEDKLRSAVNSGCTVVVAMGNDHSNIKSIPASYDIPGLIAVGSCTEAGARSSFSNYGAWEDLLAPGSDIMSTKSSGYGFMSGTSMAAPVVSGVCALYISAYGNPGPAQMEKIIKSATTNGIIDASKLFSTDKSAPTINAPSTVSLNTSISITSNSASHFVVYTTDGSTPTVKDGVVTVGTVLTNASGHSYSFQASAANGFAAGQKVTIKAISVSGLGVASNVASKTVTVNGSGGSLQVNTLTITGQSYVAPGKSATYKVLVTPAKAKNKTVTWSLASGASYASINQSGKLTVSSGAPSTTVTIRAAANDGSGKSTTYTVYISPQVASMQISSPSAPRGGSITKNSDGTLQQISMASVTLSGKWSNTVNLTATVTAANGSKPDTKLIWTSSNTKIATVESTGNLNATVTAHDSGTATITAKADDGSGKTAKFTVKVFNPASALTIVSSAPTTLYGDSFKLLGVGKSVTNKAVFGDAFGKPTVTKVNWSFSVNVYPKDGGSNISYIANEIVRNNWISLSSSGKLSAKNNSTLKSYVYSYDIQVTVTAVSTDGSGVSGSCTYRLTSSVSKLQLGYIDYPSSYYTSYSFYKSYSFSQGSPRELILSVLWDLKYGEYVYFDYDVMSSNPNIAGAIIYHDEDYNPIHDVYGNIQIKIITTGQKGTAKITVKANDGSGKTASVTVKVS